MSGEIDNMLKLLVDFVNQLETACVEFKKAVGKMKGLEASEKNVLPEETFNVLKWSMEKGARLGDYEAAYKSQNLPDKWFHCWNILKANSATIANSFHGEAYKYRYWIYPDKYDDRIFRKKLAESEAEG